MTLDQLRNILIYRDHLLAPSETFIKAQAEGIKAYRSHYVGSRSIQGLEIDPAKKWVINQGGTRGRLEEIGFKLTGYTYPLLKQLNRLKPQLVHAHFGPDGVLAAPIAERLKIPLIVTFHGYDVTTKEDYARKSYFTHRNYLKKKAYLQHTAHRFIAVSNFIKKRLILQGFPTEKIVQHYIGVDTKLFRPNPAIERENVVLFVGRLVENKGCSDLIEAMKAVQQANPEVELVIIGDGPERVALERKAAESLHRYKFLGVQSSDVVKTWMNRAKVFCVPSIVTESGTEEAFGIAFLEASAMGLPVVSNAIGGIPEAVEQGVTGLLARQKDVQALASSIRRLLQDEQLWQRMSMAGQVRTRESFDLEKQTQKLEGIYNEVLLTAKHTKAGYERSPKQVGSISNA